MALIDEVLHKLQKGKVFTTLGLSNGFFHVPVLESSRKYTAFVTQSGQYEFFFVPFKISNFPAVLIKDGTLVLYRIMSIFNFCFVKILLTTPVYIN